MSPLLTHVTVEESLPWALRPGYLLLPGSPEASNQLWEPKQTRAENKWACVGLHKWLGHLFCSLKIYYP